MYLKQLLSNCDPSCAIYNTCLQQHICHYTYSELPQIWDCRHQVRVPEHGGVLRRVLPWSPMVTVTTG